MIPLSSGADMVVASRRAVWPGVDSQFVFLNEEGKGGVRFCRGCQVRPDC